MAVGALMGGKDGVLLLAEAAGFWFSSGRVWKFWFGKASWSAGDVGACCCWLTISSSADLEMSFGRASSSLPSTRLYA